MGKEIKMPSTKVLKEFKFTHTRVGKYPYTEWFDGKIRVLEPDKHFDCEPSALRNSLSTAANKRGLSLRTSLEEDGTVVIQSMPRSEGRKPRTPSVGKKKSKKAA